MTHLRALASFLFVLGVMLGATMACSSSPGSAPQVADAGPNPPPREAGPPADGSPSDPGPADAGHVDADAGHADANADSGASHTIGKCGALADAGAWEDVTPPMVSLPGPTDCAYGTNAFVVDPFDPATVYLGTCNQGVWKSTDCGSTWTKANTGRNADAMDCGRQWTLVADKSTPGALYANTGYGCKTSGLFKSTNGGTDWDEVWPGTNPANQGVVNYDFAGILSLDPDDQQHVLLSFHASCNAPHTNACVAESHDGGATWTYVDGQAGWTGGEGSRIWVIGGKHWLWGSASNSIWSTTDGGASWTLLDANWGAHGMGDLYRSASGAYYLATAQGIARSTDTMTWTIVDPVQYVGGIIGDGTNIFASSFAVCQSWGSLQPFLKSAESDGMTWSTVPSPTFDQGGTLDYDHAHGILYTSRCQQGFWRVAIR